MITKTSTATTEQRIIIRNTKRSEPILITLHESIPKSTDEKIRVRLILPDVTQNPPQSKPSLNGEEEGHILRLPAVGAVMDDLNNLLWTESIKPEKEKEFVVKWSVDHPPSESLRYSEQHESQ